MASEINVAAAFLCKLKESPITTCKRYLVEYSNKGNFQHLTLAEEILKKADNTLEAFILKGIIKAQKLIHPQKSCDIITRKLSKEFFDQITYFCFTKKIEHLHAAERRMQRIALHNSLTENISPKQKEILQANQEGFKNMIDLCLQMPCSHLAKK